MGDELRDPPTQEWILDTHKTRGMTALSLLVGALGSLGFGAFSDVLVSAHDFSIRVAPDQFALAVISVLGIVLATAALPLMLFILHEACHGVAFRAMGARPHYGAKMIGRFFPILYAAAPGRWLARWQYMVVLLAPTVAMNLLGIVLMLVLGSWSWVAVLPMAIHLGGCVGDWWMSVVVLRLPGGNQIEDIPKGFRYRRT